MEQEPRTELTELEKKLLVQNADISRALLRDKNAVKIYKDIFKERELVAEEALYELLNTRGGDGRERDVETRILAFQKQFYASLIDVPQDWIDAESAMKEEEREAKEREEDEGIEENEDVNE